MTLQQQIEEKSRQIHTDRYSMSVSETVSMYQSGDLEIHPEFQRIFRWSISQQSRLIESMLLGIPIPPIFVAQRTDGVWDVVDGVQRLSTIFRFMGALKDAAGEPDLPEPLMKGDYLEDLQGVVWDSEMPRRVDDDVIFDFSEDFDEALRRVFKRVRLDFQIVQKESDDAAKFDLFQRLNSGTRLSEQESRNCLAVMLDPSFAHWLDGLASNVDYQAVMDISERQEAEAYGTESVLRYLACTLTSNEDLFRMGDVGEFLTNRMRDFISDDDFDRDLEERRFEFVFSTLNDALGSQAFRRYNPTTQRFTGKFSISAFEAIATGLARHSDEWRSWKATERVEKVRELTAKVWSDQVFAQRSGGGKSANRRIPYMVEVGERLFEVGQGSADAR